MVAPLLAAGARAVAGKVLAKGAKSSARGITNIKKTNGPNPTHTLRDKKRTGTDAYRGVRPHTPDDATEYDEQRNASEYYNQQRIENVQEYRRSLASTQKMLRGRAMKKTGAAMKKMGFSKGITSASQKIKVIKAVRMVFYACCILYLVQLAGWVISLAGLALENAAEFFSLSGLASLFSDTIADGIKVGEDTFEDLTGIELSLAEIIPGIAIFVAGYIIVFIAGVLTLIITAAAFIVNGVKAFDTWPKALAFVVALAGYMAPIPLFNGLPFGLLWVWAVFFSAKREG